MRKRAAADVQAMSVALVGRRLEHNENLGLGYLRAALEQAGVAVDVHYLNDPAELSRALELILAQRPLLVGLSLADGGSAMLSLALGEALAEAGFRGHVTAGGPFATLARSWLLDRYAWLDSVVRFAGEAAIVEMTRRVAASEPVHGVPGVTTRAGDGDPAGVLDPGPFALRPWRGELPEILGHPAAHMLASRGCLGRCQYCGPAALHTLERREGIRAGFDSATMTRAGVGGVRRRSVEDICDEMAELWKESGVRYFYFVDEHLLPYAEPEALELLARWKSGLEARGVGPLGIGTMLRADRITPKIARAFVELGLVRVFVGLELATEEEGRRFGRRPPGPRELSLLEDFAQAGVVTVSNLMLVNPYSTPATIAAGIDLLSRIPRGVFEATRMMPYHGTRLMKTLEREGRLVGNPLRYGYTFADASVERFSEIFTRLRAEAFYDYSVAFRTHDAFLALGLAARLHPERLGPEVRARLERTRMAVNRLYVSAYRRALDLALGGGGFREAAPLVASLRPRVAEIEIDLEAVEQRLSEVALRPCRLFAPMRSAAAGVVTFALAACGSETRRPDAPQVIQTIPPEETALEPPSSPPESGLDAAVASIDAGASEAQTEAGSPAAYACTYLEIEAVERDAKRILAKSAACFSGFVTLGDAPSAQSGLQASRGTLELCGYSGSTQHAVQAERALAGKLRRCDNASGHPVIVRVDGKSTREAEAAIKAIAPCPMGWSSGNVKIVLDSKGRVTRIVGNPQATSRCIHKALSGLRFPCLSSFEVCPEHVIIE